MEDPSSNTNAEPRRSSRGERIFFVLICIVYAIYPFFSGLLQYRWHPDENFDAERHTVMTMAPVEDAHGDVVLEPATWRSNETGEVFSHESFIWSRDAERIRVPLVWLLYGYGGCALYAIREIATGRSFFAGFGRASVINLSMAGLAWLIIGPD